MDPHQRIAAEMSTVAEALLTTLDTSQTAAACLPWPSDDERRTWFFTPTDHGGVSLHELGPAQQRLVMRLLAAVLSHPGYVTTSLIMNQDNLLDQVEGFRVDFDRERGRDPLLFWIRFFGTPGDRQWSWRFGGHHLSINVTVADGRVVSTTPFFMGADPASAPLLGPHLHRPLGGAEDLGRELARSLDPGQAAALLPVPPVDIVGSNRPFLTEGDRPLTIPEVWRGRFEGEIDRLLQRMQDVTEEKLGISEAHVDQLAFSFTPKGVAGRDLTADQREVLLALLRTYVGRIDDTLADEQLTKAEHALDDLHFLWAGSTEPGDPHYYRIQGGDLFVEYDCAQRDGNHVHTVWRDLTTDFGGDPLAEHYTNGSHRHG
ncbi:MAG: DUF3500 domain-containing protein [Actinomycetota bacterium]